MKSEHVLDAHILDIIFENRNKDYGAYALRRFYNNRLLASMGITFLLVAMVIVFVLIPGKQENTESKLEFIPGHILRDIQPMPELPKLHKKPVLPKKPSIKPAASTQLFVSRVQFVDNHPTKLASNLDSLAIAAVTNTGTAGGDNRSVTDKTQGMDSLVNPDVYNDIDRKTPVRYADVPPSFPGGEDALLRFLQRNLQNPTDLDNGQVVSVKIMFIVGYDGQLRGFEVTEDGGRLFNNEVIRVLKKMPAWNPGKNAGEEVSVYYSLPVKFMNQD